MSRRGSNESSWVFCRGIAKAVAVPPQKLNDVTSASTENKHVSREWLLFKYGLHLCTEPVETTAHIGHASGDPDPRSSAEFNHLRKLSRIKRNSTGSAPLSTLIIARPGSST